MFGEWLIGVICVVTTFLCPDEILRADQQPLRIPDDNANINDTSFSDTGAIARIALYPGSRTYPDDLATMGIEMSACVEEDTVEMIDVPLGVCLSGEYYAQNNFKVVELAQCADGSPPTMAFYQNRGCTGSPHKIVQSAETGETTGRCLWSTKEVPVPSYYWSLIYDCNSTFTTTQSSNSTINHSNSNNLVIAHKTAQPQLIYQQVLDGAQGSVRQHHEPDDCGRLPNWNIRNCDTDSVSKLVSWQPWLAMEIMAPAVCQNGTRAQLALIEELEDDARGIIMDVDDAMLRTRIPVKGLGDEEGGGVWDATVFAFHCRGGTPKQELETPPRGPGLSTSACSRETSPFRWDSYGRPPTFMYPQVKTCLPLPKGEQVFISENSYCPDGSPTRLAAWLEPGCKGNPAMITPLIRYKCESWRLGSETSYKIYCGKRVDRGIVAPEEEISPEDDPRAYVDRNVCPIHLETKPGFTPMTVVQGPPEDLRMMTDYTCAIIQGDEQLKMSKSPVCENGREARLQVYAERNCCGAPAYSLEIGGFLNTCKTVCEGCWFKFTCNGGEDVV